MTYITNCDISEIRNFEMRKERKKTMKMNLRKAVCLVLAVCLAMLGSCAFAAAIDMTVFEENEDVEVTWDEMVGTAQVKPADLFSTVFIPDGVADSFGGLCPGVLYDGDEESARFVLIGMLSVEEKAQIERMILKVGEKRYTFYDVDFDISVSDGSIIEELMILFDRETFPFLEALKMAQKNGETVKVRFWGQKYDVDFAMTDSMLETIVNMYELFEEAGGTSAANLLRLSEGNRMAVK